MLVELSHVLNQTTPPYPGDPVYGCTPTLTISKDGCSVHHVSFGTHTGTHIDAPSHFIHDGKTVDQIPLESLRMSIVESPLAIAYKRADCT
jgi:kynurenine formamidase